METFTLTVVLAVTILVIFALIAYYETRLTQVISDGNARLAKARQIYRRRTITYSARRKRHDAQVRGTRV